MDDPQRVDALGVETQPNFVLTELDGPQERQDHQRRRRSGRTVGRPGNRPLRRCTRRETGFAQRRRLRPQARQEDGEVIYVGHPLAFDPVRHRCDRSRLAAPPLRAQRMDCAVGHRDVEAQHGSAGTAPVGPRTYRDRRTLRQIVASEPVGPHRRDRADLDLLKERHAVRTSRLDLEVDVGIPPRDLCERALDQDLDVQIVGGLAVVRGRGSHRRGHGGERHG